MKKLTTIILTLSLLICLSSAAATTPGSSDDPLISKTYADETYTQKVISDGEAEIDGRLGAVYDEYADKLSSVSYNKGAVYAECEKGSEVHLIFCSSIYLLTGSAKFKINDGDVINVSKESGTIQNGSSLETNVRYFCLNDESTVTVTFSEASTVMIDGNFTAGEGVTTSLNYFTDVKDTNWYYDAAVFTYNRALFQDIETKQFRANDDITRAEMVYALWSAVGKPDCDTPTTFEDLRENWYVTAVRWAVSCDIIEGMTTTEFSPESGLTRQQMVTIMYRYTEYIEGDTTPTVELTGFEDANSVSSWALAGMKWACAVGLINGMTETTLSPTTSAQRAQVATVLMRYVG